MDISTGSGGAGGGAAPLEFLLDGVPTQVSEDTVTPANSVPLPVTLYGVAGQINVTAGNLDVQLTDQGADADVTRIGDGTNQLGITAANQAKVTDSLVLAKMGGADVRLTYDQRVITYVGATTDVSTITYKLATVTVATQTFTYDGSNRLVDITVT